LQAPFSGEDDTYLYFTAEVPGFSSFAITGEVKSLGEENETGTKMESESRTVNDNDSGNEGLETGQEQSTSMPGFGLVYGIACMFVFLLYKRKKEK
jgi:LPXTG-motif cell wall-anchored protein